MTYDNNNRRMFKNTFGPLHLKADYLSAPSVFGCLKLGILRWEKLPKEVQDGVHEYLEWKYPDVEKCGTAGEHFLAKYGGSRSLPRTTELWKRYYAPRCQDERYFGGPQRNENR